MQRDAGITEHSVLNNNNTYNKYINNGHNQTPKNEFLTDSILSARIHQSVTGENHEFLSPASSEDSSSLPL